ncbi:MAG: HYR domain-containing protein [bacterium]
MSSKRHLLCKKVLIVFFASILVLSFVGMFISVSDVQAAAAPTIIQIKNPSPLKNDLFGWSVAGISDIDGDGIGDLIVGAPGEDKVYLLSGEDQSILEIIEPPVDISGYRFGYAVSVIGDLNDDGYDDFAVGAPGPDSPKESCDPAAGSTYTNRKCGQVFLFSGVDTDVILLTLVPEDSDFWAFGSALAAIGDIDCDGTPDIAVGAPNNQASSMGKVYVFSGEDGSQIWTTSEPEPCAGEKQAKASFGTYLAKISDVTGDGRNDLLVGAPMFDCDPDTDVDLTAGRAFVLSGANGTIFREHLNPVPTLNDHFGAGACAIGDQNDDGKEDYCFGESGIGKLYLFSGSNGDPLNGDPLLIPIIESPSEGGNDYFGFSVARTDDKDGDGLDDLWVSAPKSGAVYLINGKGEFLIEIIDGNPVPSATDGGFGWQIATTEDLNDDSGLDLIIGKPAAIVNVKNKAGEVYLVLGAYVNTPPVADAGPDKTVSANENCLARIYLDGSGSYDPDGDTLTYEWTWSYGSANETATGVKPFVTLPLGVNVITLTVSDGMDTNTDTVVITVIDTTPPIIVCPPDITAEQTSADGTPVNLHYPNVTDNCDDDSLVTNNAPAVFPLGKTIVTWTAKDFSGNQSSCTQVVTIVDTTPPLIKSLTASPNNLWPPNHEMVPVAVTCVCEDICDISPVSMIISVVSNQPINGTGDGDTSPDWIIKGDLSVDLRAERSGNDKQGRIYTITVECTDFSGNSSRAAVNVIVPHDQGKKSYNSQYYNTVIYNNLTSYYSPNSYNTSSQSITIIPAVQTQAISTLSALSLNVNNVANTTISVKNNKAPISVVVNSNQATNLTTSKQAKGNTSFTINNSLPSNPLAQSFTNIPSFGLLNQQTFFNGNNNWTFSGNNNWSLSNSLGNHWGWGQNLYTPKIGSSFNFVSGSSFSFFNNKILNNFQFP